MNEKTAGPVFALAFSCDADGAVTALSGPGLPWLTDPAGKLGRPFAELLPAAAAAKLNHALEEALDSGNSLTEVDHEKICWIVALQAASLDGQGVSGALGTICAERKKREPLRLPVDEWPLCVFELDSEARIYNINQSGAGILGAAEPEALLGRQFDDLISPQDSDRIGALVTKGYSGQPSQFEFTDRSGRFFRCSLFPYRTGPSDKVCCLFGLAQVIAKRRTDESTFAGSEQEYRLLVQNAPFCIHQIDLDGRLMSMNAAGLAMMGMADEQEIIGLRYLDAVSDADRHRIEKLLNQAFAGHASEFEFHSAGGQVFSSSFVPIRDQHGKVARLMGLTRDATDERMAQRGLRESEQRLELALKAANLGLWDLNVDSGDMVLDGRWATLLGFATNDLAPTVDTVRRLIHPDDHESQHLRLKEHLNGETASYESTHRMRGSDGRWRWIVDRGMVTHRDEQGQPLRITGTSAEITGEYEAIKQRRELEARLQQAQRMESIGHLAGGIAHDFNNVLTVISGNVDFALDEIAANRSPTECLEQIQSATERASELISQLMTFSRRRPVRMTYVDLNSLSREIFELVTRVMPENIRLKIESEPSLPLIEADPSQLEQIVLNLCVNARDAMPDGGVLGLSLTTEVGEDNAEWVALEVSDNGHGMDEATQAKAFDPFFTTKQKSKGTGLGLAMVYGSVQQHGGRVSLQSGVNAGTKVVIHFPACERGIEKPAQIQSDPGTGKETVLVVEDEGLVRDLAAKVLSRAGYRVLTAVDGQDGVEVFQRHTDEIEIVLLDIVMPRLNGGEACKAMLKIKPGVRILFTSGYDQNNALPIPLMREHNFQMIPKPYNNHTLLGQIRQMLDH